MSARALSELGAILETLGIRWTLIGAVAANRYRREVRLTGDVDLLLASHGAGLEARPRDLDDIEEILATHPALDEDYVERWAAYWDVLALWRRLRHGRGP